MFRIIAVVVAAIWWLLAPPANASTPPAFVTVVNPIRGSDFWDRQDQQPETAVAGQMEILKEKRIIATWLIRPDALTNKGIIDLLKSGPAYHEKGLFLEVTPSWAKQAGVVYRESAAWHLAESVFLTGYEPNDRKKLIDAAFEQFKSTFGGYPKSVGAWWIDSYSLDYMERKYHIVAAMIVADQYSTDNYQIWGQYFGTPYYPQKRHALHPAQNTTDKIPVVILQWAPRDPFNGYGGGVQESTYSVQANDYVDYHDLDSNYFKKLLDIYLRQPFNQFGQLTVGLENSYSWEAFAKEYEQQIDEILKRAMRQELQPTSMGDFAIWYASSFPTLSPEHMIIADDPLGKPFKAVWYMNPYYRAGWFYNQDGSSFRDIRQYAGDEEPCYLKPCQEINFALGAVRVLDDVSFGQKWVLDQGRISDFKLTKTGESFLISYQNEAGKEKKIELLPRDITVDGMKMTIDSAIAKAVSGQVAEKQDNLFAQQPDSPAVTKLASEQSLLSWVIKIVKLLIFVVVGLLLPGYLLGRFNLFLSICLGMVGLTLISAIAGYLKAPWLSFLYLLAAAFPYLVKATLRKNLLDTLKVGRVDVVAVILILAGIIFQSTMMMRSGWIYSFGMGFWGPLGHDGIWHQALISQLVQAVPPQNPGLAGQTLSNYHYFYDLLVATTHTITQIPIIDLLYRFYPVFLSLLLGVGSYQLVTKLAGSRLAAWLSLYLVYFAGSFGWIVEWLRERHLGGESAFWANQPVSMNLNPPFAISLVLMVAILLAFKQWWQEQPDRRIFWMVVLLAGLLIEFKVYAGIVVLVGLFLTGIGQWLISHTLGVMKVFVSSAAVAVIVFLPQNVKSGELLVLSPFWFIHSMVDITDRVGWARLSLARQAYLSRGEWIKLILAEGLALVLFVVGNLGTRVVGLFALVAVIKKKLWQDPLISLIFWISLVSLVTPIIFVQKGNPWNTIQFFYYFLYLTALLAGVSLAVLVRKFGRIGWMMLVVLLIVTPINAVTTFRSGFYENPPSRITKKELTALIYLAQQPEGVVLTYPYETRLKQRFNDPFPMFIYESTAYVAAFSNKATFIEDEPQQQILQTDYRKRLVGAKEFFSGRDLTWSKNFLKENQIRYIYSSKLFNLPSDTEKLGLKLIFDNQEVVIFEVL